MFRFYHKELARLLGKPLLAYLTSEEALQLEASTS